jgi:hypothetical protein
VKNQLNILFCLLALAVAAVWISAEHVVQDGAASADSNRQFAVLVTSARTGVGRKIAKV